MRFMVFVIAVSIAAGGFWFSQSSIQYKDVEVINPIKGEAVEAVYATGIVEATIMMPLSIRHTARLVELNVDEGQEVLKGQVLARMEDSDLKKKLENFEAKADYALKDYDRKKSLLTKGYETKSSIDQAKADLDAANAAVEQIEVEIGLMQITAPEDGKIIKRDGEIGQIISANEPVFWLSCCAPLRISAEVDEEDIASVKVGQNVLIRADAFPGKIFTGEVQGITPKGDPIMRSYRVRIKFTELTPLHIGMTTESNIIISKKENTILVPSSAIKKDLVLVVNKGSLIQKKTIKTGIVGMQRTEVLRGLSRDDMVVSEYNTELTIGQKVTSKTVKVK